MSKLSVVIITLNEEKNLGRCLQSVTELADEVVVVDSGSTDQTKEIAANFKATVIHRDWEGYASAKNFAVNAASHDLILSLDADEALSEELKEAILSVKPEPEKAYKLSRLTNYCGKWIRHGGWYPDYKIRLFDRRHARWEGDFVHESVVVDDSIKIRKLKGDLLHYSFDSLNDHLNRINSYSELAAEELVMAGSGSHFRAMLFSPPLKFLKTYILKRGFQDGFYGFCISSFSAIDVFVRHAKAIQLKRVSTSS